MFIQPEVDLSTLQARRINIREEQTDDTKMPLARACKLSVHGLHLQYSLSLLWRALFQGQTWPR